MSKHTDGPWWFDADFYVLAGEDTNIICELWTPDREANGRLIAAAPDLLEALKQARLHSAMPHTLREQIEAVIAKAEGR